MSVFLIVGPKCTLVASHAASWWVMVSMPTGQTDRQTDRCQTVTLRFPLDAVIVTECMEVYTEHRNAIRNMPWW